MSSFWRYFVLFFLTLAGWFIFSGYYYKPFFIITGLMSCLFTLWVAHRMNVIDPEGHPMQITWKAPVYWLWLLKEMFLSSLQVATQILSPKPHVSPSFGWVDSKQQYALGHVVYANSITLTPGTVSVNIEEHSDSSARIYVHALQSESLKELKEGAMERRVRSFTGER